MIIFPLLRNSVGLDQSVRIAGFPVNEMKTVTMET